jgi:hypothetical protein
VSAVRKLAPALCASLVLALCVLVLPAEATGVGKIRSVVLATLDSLGVTSAGVYTTPQAADTDLSDLAAVSRTRGDLIYGGASAWTDLAPGTAGYVLSTGGAGADPSWAEPFYRCLSAQRGTSTSLTFSVPAATLANAEDALHFVASGILDDAGEAVTVTLGGQTIFNTAISGTPWTFEGRIVRTAATTCLAYGVLTNGTGGAGVVYDAVSLTVTLANANDLVAGFSGADAGDEVHLLRVYKERAP